MASVQSHLSMSLLIVEDDTAACDLIVSAVTMRFPGISIYTGVNGIQGVELFKQFHPDIVMADVNMPVMDGIEMMREIRSINAKAACIMVTAYSDKRIIEKITDLGACAYLLKPLNFNKLFEAIEKCGARITAGG